MLLDQNEVKTGTAVAVNPDLAPYYIELGRNKINKDGDLIFVRNDYRQITKQIHQLTVIDYINRYTNEGWGLYSTAFQYDGPDPYEAKLRGDFFMDFDDEDNIKNAQEDALRIIQHLMLSPNFKIPQNMIKVFFSGKKGIHLTIPYQCFGVDWHADLDKIYRIMAEELSPYAINGTLDMKVYEKRRLFRLVRSKHPSTGAYKVPMELRYLLKDTENEIQDLSRDQNYGNWIRYDMPRLIPEAAAYFQQCEKKAAERYTKKFVNDGEEQSLDFDPPCYELMIEAGPTKGSRNHVACMLVAFWRQRGLSEQEAWDNLVNWNNDSLSERELTTLFRSNFNGQYVYGCRTIKEYAICPATCREDCKFFKSS